MQSLFVDPFYRRRASFLSVIIAATAVADAQAGEEIDGAELWQRDCAICHELGAHAQNGIGPGLSDIIGAGAGAQAGYHYSDTLRAAAQDGLVWDRATLDAFITDPNAVISGTIMAYPGLPSDAERNALLDFIESPPEGITRAQVEIDLSDEILGIEGDIEYGAFLAAECTTCHQADGSAQGIPSITGWPEAQFVTVMHAYKEGLRQNEVMRNMARRLGNEEIAALAAYFAQR